MKKLIAFAAVAASIATPALAQDGERAPFTGLFVGGLLGYDNVRGQIPAVGSEHRDGLLYGGVIGYDVNVNGAIFGVEGEYTDSETKLGIRNFAAVGDSLSLNTDRDLYAGVRIGGQVANNLMVYAKGGYTNARFETNYTLGNVSVKDGENLDGYRLGAGIETTYSGFTGRVEYRYSDYGKFDDINVNRHQVAAVIGYRF